MSSRRATGLLFVGYGLADDDFDQVLGRVRALAGDQAPRHFALVPSDTVTPFRKKKLEDAGLRLIPYDNADGKHSEVVRILRELAPSGGGGGGGGGRPTTITTACPFPGLLSFDEERAEMFFGRDSEIAEAIQGLGDTSNGHRRWLQIEGPSGAGKSSLARAGVVPKVRQGWIAGGPPAWRVAVLRPGPDPPVNLAQAVHAALEDVLPASLGIEELIERFYRSERALKTVLREHSPAGHGFLLVVDQLEEAFTLAGNDRKALDCFDAVLAEAVRDKGGPLYLVTTIRSDCGFLEKALELFKALAAADPSNAQDQVGLAGTHNALAHLAQAACDPAAVSAHVAAAQAILDRLDRAGLGKGSAEIAWLRAALAELPK